MNITDAANELEVFKLKVRHLNERNQQLEVALNRMVLAHENTQADSEGKWPQPDCGCVYCTQGTVPDKLNTGPCALHNAKSLLGQL